MYLCSDQHRRVRVAADREILLRSEFSHKFRPKGLLPVVYFAERIGKLAVATSFQRIGGGADIASLPVLAQFELTY